MNNRQKFLMVIMWIAAILAFLFLIPSKENHSDLLLRIFNV